MEKYTFSFLISTKNRSEELLFTLQKINHLLNDNVKCIVYDDGSTDGTFHVVKTNFPNIHLIRHEISKGYLYCRNRMLNETKADFAISLDDDAHFITQNTIEIISRYFEQNPRCGLIATRIFWSKSKPLTQVSHEVPQKVKSFVGCGHIWRMKAWREIPNYPEWLQFYGEEDIASMQLLKKKWEVHYVPEILVHHRVNLAERTKSKADFGFRYRRSIRAGWYAGFLFFPFFESIKMFLYSVFYQLKSKVFKGNFIIIIPLFLAHIDLLLHIPKLIKNRNVFTKQEYEQYLKLNEAKIYWKPEN
jgi:glycosyltransferase involved in cell wall biosynthesis